MKLQGLPFAQHTCLVPCPPLPADITGLSWSKVSRGSMLSVKRGDGPALAFLGFRDKARTRCLPLLVLVWLPLVVVRLPLLLLAAVSLSPAGCPCCCPQPCAGQLYTALPPHSLAAGCGGTAQHHQQADQGGGSGHQVGSGGAGCGVQTGGHTSHHAGQWTRCVSPASFTDGLWFRQLLGGFCMHLISDPSGCTRRPPLRAVATTGGGCRWRVAAWCSG